MTLTCGEVTIRLLEHYGVDTVFIVPNRSHDAAYI